MSAWYAWPTSSGANATVLPSAPALARRRRVVGPRVVSSVAATPMRTARRTASSASASSIRTTGTATARWAAATASPTEEQALRITAAPACSAKQAYCTQRPVTVSTLAPLAASCGRIESSM